MGRQVWIVTAVVLGLLAGVGGGVFWSFSRFWTPGEWSLPLRPIEDPAAGGGVTSAGLVQALVLALIALGLAYLWQRRRGVGSTVPPADRPSIDERLASAFAQLHSAGPDGVPDVEVRLLGLRDLREIALESPRDAWPIAQALAQYVRRVAPRHAQADTAPAAPRADVQAALTLLARRPGRIGLGEDAPLDLSGTDLRGADLAGANLVAVRFDGADLRGAHLDHTDLAGAGLRGVDLRDARGLTLEQLAAAVTDAATRLPDPLR